MDIGFGRFFSEVATGWSPYILALNVIGGITMAVLQTAKDLLPIRRGFQRWQLQKWFQEGARRANKGAGRLKPTEEANSDRDAPAPHVKATAAESHLLELAANGDHRAFFDQQPEDLCGLFNATIQVALESPALYGDLLRVTASRADPHDLRIAAGGIPEPMTQEYLDARNRVLHQCQRAIGAFQVDSDFRWKWIMQLLALVVSTVLAAAALSQHAVIMTANQKMTATPFSIAATALLAGFLAPVAKDLLAIVQRARGQ